MTEATEQVPAKRRRGCLTILGYSLLVAFIFFIAAAIGGYFYWQSVKKTPEYSLALLVDAARRDDKEMVSKIVATDEVVNSLVPQITDKAVELYGRNLSPAIISRVASLVTPLMPAIKAKAKDELPKLIREKTAKADRVPYQVIALFARTQLEIKIDGDTAEIKSLNPEQPLDLTMKRDGDMWKIVAVRDANLAQKIAEKVGQQLIALASKGSVDEAGKLLGVENLGNVLKGLNDIFR